MNYQKQLLNELVKETAAFLLLTVSIVLLWRNNLLLFTTVLFESMVALHFWHDHYDLSFLLVIAVLGSMAEIVFVHFGVWCYANPSLLGIPLWFPPAFGTSGLIAERLVRTITALWGKRAIDKLQKC